MISCDKLIHPAIPKQPLHATAGGGWDLELSSLSDDFSWTLVVVGATSLRVNDSSTRFLAISNPGSVTKISAQVGQKSSPL
jgi:hypothetical protein